MNIFFTKVDLISSYFTTKELDGMEITKKQIESVARYFVRHLDNIKEFYEDEKNEIAYQKWLKQRNERLVHQQNITNQN